MKKELQLKNKKRRVIGRKGKIVLAIFIWGITAFVLVSASGFVSAVYSAKEAKQVWINWQKNYIDFLESSYSADPEFCKVNESSFITSDLTIEDVAAAKLNQIRYIASHNSYKTGLTPETKYLYHGPFAAFMGKQYDYVFDTITEQLNCGIRSIELDVGKVKTKEGFIIECVHSDMLETNSTMVNFSEGLREINMWLTRNPDSMPVIVLVEPKGGKSFDTEAFDKLDEIIYNAFGEKLITPAKLLNGYSDFDAFRAADAYPKIESLKGKILFLLHEKASLDFYIERDPELSRCAMNIALEYKTAIKKKPEYSKYAFTLIMNEPTDYSDKFPEVIENGNFMIRTRLDKYRVIKEKDYVNGLNSNANILSTDYTPHITKRIYDYPTKEMWNEKYIAALYEEGKTITLRK